MTTNAPKKPEEETVNRGRFFAGRSLDFYEQRTREQVIEEVPLLERRMPELEKWMSAHGKKFKEPEPTPANAGDDRDTEPLEPIDSER